MDRRQVQLIIVGEDIQQSAFARRYLVRRGFHPRKIRIVQNPAGKGSGEQFVRTQLVKEVQSYRRKANYQQGLALLALVDADTYTLNERITQINAHLADNGLDAIQDNERIAILVPKRNIETWIEYANCYESGDTVSETETYPKLTKPSTCKVQVDIYAEKICINKLPADAPASLHHACTELAKIR